MSGSKKVFTTLGSSNHVPEEREAFDYYATDPRAVEMLLELEQFSPVIWEPACGEGHISKVLQAHGYANSYEQNYQAQYDYYKAGNSRVAYNHSAVSTAVWWWLRSPYYTYNYYFRTVNTDGGGGNGNAYYCAGVRPGFAA